MLLLQIVHAGFFECSCNLRRLNVDLIFCVTKKARLSYHPCPPFSYIENIQAIALSGLLQKQVPPRMVPSPPGLTLPSHPTSRQYSYGPRSILCTSYAFSCGLRFASLVHSGISGQDSQTGGTQTGPGPPCRSEAESSRLMSFL